MSCWRQQRTKNPLESLWNASECRRNTSYTQKRAGKSILLDLFPLFRTILYDRHIPIQTLINITLLRNVMLTAPFGAWATCDLTAIFGILSIVGCTYAKCKFLTSWFLCIYKKSNNVNHLFFLLIAKVYRDCGKDSTPHFIVPQKRTAQLSFHSLECLQ